MKSIIYFKLVTITLLAVFLIASAYSVFGYAWCVGDDGHVEVAYSSNTRCCADEQEKSSSVSDPEPGLSLVNGDSCGSCLDFSAQQSDAVFFKRVKRSATVYVAPLTVDLFSLHPVRNLLLAAAPPSSRVQRISQTILVLRTVVLLA